MVPDSIPFKRASELVSNKQSGHDNPCINTGIEHIDAYLNEFGGIPSGKITEISGLPGLGKTHICMTIAMQQSKLHSVLYVDTCGGLCSSRFLELTDNTSNIHVARTCSVNEFFAALILAENMIVEGDLKCIIIDTIAHPLRIYDLNKKSEEKSTNFLINTVRQRLVELMQRYQITIIVSNEMTTKMGDRDKMPMSIANTSSLQTSHAPSLGEGWSSILAMRIQLYWGHGKRCLKVMTTAMLQRKQGNMTETEEDEDLDQEKDCMFEITEDGVCKKM